MLTPENTALVLLAAGRSERFADGDKLTELYLGQPLAFHVVTALEKMPFRARIAVVSCTALDFAARGFEVVENPDPAQGQARSVRHGVEAAEAAGVEAVLIALADMPRLTVAHCYRLFDASEGAATLVASSDGVRPMPPALFGRDHFAALRGLEGDAGARTLILRGHHVITQPDELVDIDTREDLAALRDREAAAAIRAARRRSD
ncbi:nucleotidyltransferase family protein [Sphingomonas sp. HT-1]|uniref:nucleotidyltransferase family protein n=1 Tax=unclassified Sphingomonas TaxID=196159 RepID=UPI0002F32F73|nr:MULTISPECIES: nucleotidyltransferase family protein [unclassified Sphingomonas]KTF69954.1 MobA [Sphingomonas sp. WG]